MIGRIQEQKKLAYLSQSSKAELLAVIGRRRVGKTFLVREFYQDQIVFEFTGTQHASRKNQLEKFSHKLAEYSKSPLGVTVPANWSQAFLQLKVYLQHLQAFDHKPVIFFDELPWIASPRSGFLQEFGYWWNDWASRQQIIVVICGSAASWMIDKVLNHKGSLHNRITELIHLQPFTLSEVKNFVDSIPLALDNHQILQLYMSLGGIPHYLQHIRKGESATQIINRLCFQKDSILRNEFNNLYLALFEGAEKHISIVRALATKWKGLTRNEIIEATGLSNGGGLTQILHELSSSSFIIEIIPFGKKRRDTLYRLVDEYSLFYLSFIEGKRAFQQDAWMQAAQSQVYRIWRGYAFENICIKHVAAIKQALGISGIQTEVSSFYHASNEGKGFQIDMLIDRADRCINLCEMKFYTDELTLTKDDADKLRRRRTRFQTFTNSQKTLFNTLITTYGVNPNAHSNSQVDQVVNMDALFLLESFS